MLTLVVLRTFCIEHHGLWKMQMRHSILHCWRHVTSKLFYRDCIKLNFLAKAEIRLMVDSC